MVLIVVFVMLGLGLGSFGVYELVDTGGEQIAGVLLTALGLMLVFMGVMLRQSTR